MPPDPIEALLFDLGGVVIDIDFGRVFACWAAYANQTIETIKSRFVFDSYYERHERGEIQTTEYFAALRRSLGINITNDEFREGWNSIYIGEIPGMANLLSEAKEKRRIYAFTNSNAMHQRVWSKRFSDVLGLFKKVFVSSEIGKRKPEPGAFRFVSREIGLEPAHILFFDDSMENVAGAQAVGMLALHVKSPSDIKTGLRDFFIL